VSVIWVFHAHHISKENFIRKTASELSRRVINIAVSFPTIAKTFLYEKFSCLLRGAERRAVCPCCAGAVDHHSTCWRRTPAPASLLAGHHASTVPWRYKPSGGLGEFLDVQ